MLLRVFYFYVVMSSTELPLYPKLSSIYNKIMQLAIAIVLIIVVMNIWIASDQQSKAVINKHFNTIGQDYIAQASATVSQLLADNKTEQQNNALKKYLDTLVVAKAVNSVSFYDETGQLIINVNNDPTMNEIYAHLNDKQKISAQYIPFVREIRRLEQVKNGIAEVQGYLRLTINKPLITQTLTQAERDKSQLERLMLMIAGLIGFLLTRGLNRFSRQSFRLVR